MAQSWPWGSHIADKKAENKSLSLPRNLAHVTFGKFLSVLSKGKSATLPLFNGLEVLPSASNKAKLFNFSMNSNLDDSDIFLLAFRSRTYLKLHNIHYL